MTIAEICVFALVVVYLGSIAYAKALGVGQFDNANPRDARFYADPRRRRARDAHVNGMEAFPLFLGAVLLAEFRAAPQATVDTLAAVVILARIAYVAAYVGDRATFRSICWFVGFAGSVAIFFLPAFTHH